MKNETDPPNDGQDLTERPSVTDIAEICDQVELDFGRLSRRLVPILVGAVAETQGTEGAKITIAIGYKPGSKNTLSRLGVSGGVNIPGGGYEHEVAIAQGRKKGDPNQLVLFTD